MLFYKQILITIFIILITKSFAESNDYTESNRSNANETLDSKELQYKKIIQLKALSEITYEVLKYYSLVIVILGTVLNLINFACFFRMKKRNSQNVYLSALSLADLFNIHINITVPLFKTMYPAIIERLYQPNTFVKVFFCNLESYFVEVGLLLPVWVMVVLAFERFFCIMWPLRKNNFATPKYYFVCLYFLLYN